MLQTLFYIPDRLFGLPVFGVPGILFAIWAVGALIAMARQVYRYGLTVDAGGLAVLLAFLGAVLVLFLPSLLEHRDPSNPEALGLPIRGYGVMVLIGVISAVALAIHRARQRGVDPEIIISLALWLFVGGMLGARAFYVIEYWRTQFYRVDAASNFDLIGTLSGVLNIAKGGLVIYGALIGGAASSLYFLLKFRLPVLRLADIAAPSMVLGLAIGRIGCFFNGCCFGGACDLPWAVQFPERSPPYERQLEQGQLYLHGLAFNGRADEHGAVVAAVKPGSAAAVAGVRPGDQIREISVQPPGDAKPRMIFPRVDTRQTPSGLSRTTIETLGAAEEALLGATGEGARVTLRLVDRPEPVQWTITADDEPPTRSLSVHPTQLYSAIDAGLLCLLLLAFDPLRRREGEVFALMLGVHAIARFLLESIRTDEPKAYLGMSISQFLSVIMLVAAAVFWLYLLSRPAIKRRELPAAPT